MDAPDLDPDLHRQALRALSRVHALSGTGPRLHRALDAITDDLSEDRPIRMLDVACGGGDAVLDAVRWASRRGRPIEVTGLDLSETALEIASERIRDSEPSHPDIGIEWVRRDALRAMPEGPFDLVFSSLFLHHLSDDDVVSFFTAARERVGQVRTRRGHARRRATRRGGTGRERTGQERTGEDLAGRANGGRIWVEDLRRTRVGHLMAWATLRAVSRSRIAHVDGPRSVRAGWRRGELLGLAEDAGLSGCRVQRVWPQRLLLDWTGP